MTHTTKTGATPLPAAATAHLGSLAPVLMMLALVLLPSPGWSDEPAPASSPSVTPQTTRATLDIGWWSADGGGSRSTGGSLALVGTAGQSDAGVSTGGTLELSGGFCSVAAEPTLFADGFESGSTNAWSSTTGGL